MDARTREEERQRESEAILRRIRQETEPQTGGLERIVLRAREHFTAGDADPADRIEVLGTRIGRLFGLAMFVVLVAMLVRQFV